MKLICGTVHPEFSQKVAEHLKLELCDIKIKRFYDTEVYVKVNEKVRGEDTYVIQPTSRPVNDNLMELLLIIDALKRSSVNRINVVMPYFGYARQDRRASARECIGAKLVANLLTNAGANRIITVDLHSPQIVGFFDIDVDHFEAYSLFAELIKKRNYKDFVAVSSDAGFAKKTRKFAKALDCPLAIIDKRRPRHNQAEIVNIIGDVKNKTCVLLDDMIDTAGTIAGAANALSKKGAKEVIICATHGVFSKDAIEKLDKCAASEIIVTDTYPIPKEKQIKKLKIITITKIMAQVINRIHNNESLGELFTWEDKVNV
jgi:ribose-phosphate pyrophosphokinase